MGVLRAETGGVKHDDPKDLPLIAITRGVPVRGLSIGEPPTAGEVMAYTRGELAPDEEARIRERLIAYPDLVRALTAPFPEGAEPDHPDYLSDHEFARNWSALQKRRRRPDRGLQFWRAFGAIAAALAVVFGALLWRAQTALKQPQAVWEQQELYPDGLVALEVKLCNSMDAAAATCGQLDGEPRSGEPP